MSVRALLAVLLLFIAAVEAEPVSFWLEDFYLECPESGEWFHKENKDLKKPGKTYQDKYGTAKKGRYYCQYDTDKKYYFYVQGKVCPDCVELDATFLMIAIIVDIIFTGVVMMIVFKCTKKRSSAEATHTSKPPVRSGGRGPPNQSSEYETLNQNTRSQGTYSVVNRMG